MYSSIRVTAWVLEFGVDSYRLVSQQLCIYSILGHVLRTFHTGTSDLSIHAATFIIELHLARYKHLGVYSIKNKTLPIWFLYAGCWEPIMLLTSHSMLGYAFKRFHVLQAYYVMSYHARSGKKYSQVTGSC